MSNLPPNTLYAQVKCLQCGKAVDSGIGFKAGKLAGLSYKIGQQLIWNDAKERPPEGNLKTIGYFECDNLSCESWHDCYPDVQEALIVIHNDVITEVSALIYKPGQLDFDNIEPKNVP